MQKSFRGVLEPVDLGISSVMVRIPFDPIEVWPVRSKFRVKGAISTSNKTVTQAAESLSIATSLLRSRDRGYFLLVTGRMRKALRVSVGAQVEITIEPDLDDLAATPPQEFAKFLKADRSLKKWFATLNYSTRKYVADDIQSVKSAETRKRRAEQWAERMLLTMEGEEYPPPILQAAFRRQPMARARWDALTANQRRTALIGIFSAKSPEAQAKRVEWLLDETMRTGKRTDRRTDRRTSRAKDASNFEE